MRRLEKTWQMATPDVGTVSLAVSAVDGYPMSFWDAATA